ncbi:leucine-rich repeat-containing protein 74B-like isoform X2 [Anneissia japonica]|uniref:leucine-rich repeat-containing protein 74B-like isoform X2 n=1 Tax=Anneissia japonica TaxID=1529436 RepID=UPI00142558B3|nr:leucine-rich repeat-containing protein 74B-like isoform X2 [Anneissia japonica]
MTEEIDLAGEQFGDQDEEKENNNDVNLIIPNRSSSRAPSRAKSRGSIGDQRKTISRAASSQASRPGSRLSEKDEVEEKKRAASQQTFVSDASAGWDTDLEVEEVRESYDASGRTTYIEACRINGVIPVSYVLRHITDAELTMKHHGLGPAGAKALAIALVSNTTISKLNLGDNWLDASGGEAIGDMLKENCYITDLDLSENRLGNQGARALCDMLLNNATLTHVTLSGNGFEDKSAESFAEVILGNSKLEYLNLSHNEFSESAGLILGPAIAENINIKHIDLSWNHIRRKGALALAKGIMNNIGLKKVDLSWNGFGNEGAQAIGEALKLNSSLEELDITNNRIPAEGAILISKGLAVNESLKVLKIGKNPMQTAGCYGIVKACKDNANTAIESIEFLNIQVNKDFDELFKELKELRPDMKVKHGGMQEEVKPKARLNPMVKLYRYIQKNNLRFMDFFNKVDKDGSMSVTYDEFEEGLKEIGIDLNQEEIAWLINEFDRDGDGDINYSLHCCFENLKIDAKHKNEPTHFDLIPFTISFVLLVDFLVFEWNISYKT